LIGATKTLAAELAPYNIRVNAIAPGVIETNMTSDLPQEAFSRLMSKSSIKRKGMTDEVANVLLFLASDLSSYVTGQVIRVDGGIG
jgi:3-oxoacyl-[acyl-carrier protein] reductase